MNEKVVKKVIIDAGHGGNDPGAVNGNILEKNFNLESSKYIYNRLQELGIPTEMTRTFDESLPKNERIEKIKNIGIDPNVILVSNHINSGGGEGAEVIYALRNNDTLANKILDNFGETGQIKRKVYQRRLPENPNNDYYYIIRETSPAESVLVEYGFIDNQNDLKRLQNNLTNYAEGVVKALADYTNTPYKLPGQSDLGDNNTGGYYIVQKGDTLWGISNNYGLSVEELKELNNLTSNTISIGQMLLVNPIASNKVYIVKKGDSLWSIAKAFDSTVNDLIKYNNLVNLILQIGQPLLIPNLNSNVDNIINYIVQKGDTLWSIAKQYDTTVDNIITTNNLTSTLLQPNQNLTIIK